MKNFLILDNVGIETKILCIFYGLVAYLYVKVIVVHIGTNNVKNDTINEIAKGIYDI